MANGKSKRGNGRRKNGNGNGSPKRRRPAGVRRRRGPARGARSRVVRPNGNRGIPLARRTTQSAARSSQIQVNSGRDFLGKVVLKKSAGTTPADRLVFDLQLNPTNIPGTRLAQLGTMFEKYRFLQADIMYVPAIPATVGGQIIGYYDLDPKDSLSDATTIDEASRVALAHQNSKMFNIYGQQMFRLPLATGITDFFMDKNDNTENVRLNVQARFQLMQLTDVTGETGSGDNVEAGSLFLSWRMLCKNPQIQPELVGGDDAVENWNSIYKTDWEGGLASLQVTTSQTDVASGTTAVSQGSSVRAYLFQGTDFPNASNWAGVGGTVPPVIAEYSLSFATPNNVAPTFVRGYVYEPNTGRLRPSSLPGDCVIISVDTNVVKMHWAGGNFSFTANAPTGNINMDVFANMFVTANWMLPSKPERVWKEATFANSYLANELADIRAKLAAIQMPVEEEETEEDDDADSVIGEDGEVREEIWQRINAAMRRKKLTLDMVDASTNPFQRMDDEPMTPGCSETQPLFPK